ncbi:ComEA family DNA-binding protein [Actinomadura viridis]|uniref:ComEA family DNA-binding protein n=1 Tax=Actinomadura viridis TaxID=58110 RepID=UPI00367A2668
MHLAVLTAEPGPSARQAGDANAATVPLIERRVRREQARSLVAHHPSVARRLGVGRPDLPRTFDDGGLVDVNAAPEHLLAGLPGLDTYHAKLIVAVREAQGPYTSIDDLVTRGVLPAQVVRALYETLVLIPPDTEPDVS